MSAARILKHGEIALTPSTKTEVVTDEQVAHVEPAHEDVVDEATGGLRCESGVEAAHVHTIHPAGFEQQQLLAQRGEAGGRVCGSEILARMRLEGEHDRRQAESARLVREQLEQGLVAAMHPVEVADREYSGPVGLRRNPAKDLHDRLKKSQL